ncbi:hypothetical protein D3C75_422580 [compost metagenome]
MVNLFQTAVIFHFEPISECILTIITVTFAAELIGDVPADNCRMMSVTLCQLGVDQRCFFPVDRGSEAVIVPDTVQIPHTVALYTQYFRIFS